MEATAAQHTDGETQDPRDRELEDLRRQLRQAEQAQNAGVTVDPHEQDRPWNVAQQNAGDEHTRPVAPVPYRGPGAVLHSFPILTGGSGGPQVGPYVRALAELLAELGYSDNGVIRGQVGHFDNGLMSDIRRFQLDNDVRDPVQAFAGHAHPAEDIARNLIGPYTVQAIFEKAAEKSGQDVQQLIARVEYEVGRKVR